jgi:YggT family protein
MTFILATTRDDVANYVGDVFYVYGLIVLAYIVSSLFFGFGGRIPYARWSNAILTFLREVSEPLLRPFRALLPNLGPFDFSPILALIALQLVGRLVVSLIRG